MHKLEWGIIIGGNIENTNSLTEPSTKCKHSHEHNDMHTHMETEASMNNTVPIKPELWPYFSASAEKDFFFSKNYEHHIERMDMQIDCDDWLSVTGTVPEWHHNDDCDVTMTLWQKLPRQPAMATNTHNASHHTHGNHSKVYMEAISDTSQKASEWPREKVSLL